MQTQLLLFAVLVGPLLTHPSYAIELAKSGDSASMKMPQALSVSGFKRFSALIEAAGLTESLESDGPFTCFAPTDASFEAMTAKEKRLFVENPKKQAVVQWILSHFVEGAAMDRETLTNKVSGVHTMAKSYVRVWVTPSQISINNISPLVITDIAASNGIIHGLSVPYLALDPVQKLPATPVN